MEETKNMEVEAAAAEAEAPKKQRKPVRHMMWAVALISLALMLVGQLLGDLFTGSLAAWFHIQDGALLFLLTYLSFIGIDLVVLLYTRLCERPVFRSFGLRAPGGGEGNTPRLFGIGLLVGFGLNALCILLAWLHGDLHFSFGVFRPLYLLAALLCVCVQSGAEELLCRGYMMGALRDRYNIWVAAAFNALFFGALHLFNDGVTVLGIANVVMVGFALSVAMIKLKSLWFCVAVHTAWNFSQSIFFGLPNSGIVSQGSFLHLEAARDSVFYNTGFGVESSFPAALSMLGLTAVLLLIGGKEAKKADASEI